MNTTMRKRVGPAEVSYGLFAVLAVVWGLAAANYWVFVTTSAVLLAISTLGLTVVVGWAREVSLMQAGLTGLAVYVGGYAYRQDGGWGWPFLVAVAFTVLVVVLVSLVVSLATARLSGIYIMVLTLGVQLTIEQTIFKDFKFTGGQTALATPRPTGFQGDVAFYFLCLAVLGATVLALRRLRSSRHGQALLLVGTDRQAAASVGISPWRYKMFAFAIAGFFAGVAGALTGPLFQGTPATIPYLALYSLLYLAIPVLAGFGSLFAVVLVALGFGLAPQALEPLRISPLILGGAGLYVGTLAGRAGVSGIFISMMRRRRQRAARPASARPAVPSPADAFEPAGLALSQEER